MNEFIEKFIEKIENEAFAVQLEKGIKEPSTLDAMLEKFSVFRIKEIVNQLAEEYNNEAVKGDLISKKAVITELNGIYLDNPWDDKEDILEKAIGIVDHFPTAYNNGWIPCSEQLYPTATGYYLVTIKGFNRPMYAWWIWTERKWQYLNSQREIEDVIAWRELPAPYQPKGE